MIETWDTSEDVIEGLDIDFGPTLPIRERPRRVPLSGGDMALAVVAAVLLALIGLIVASGGRVDLTGAESNPTEDLVAARGAASVGL